MIICITGMPGSGKTETAKIFAEMGFGVEEMGDELRRQAKAAMGVDDGPSVWEFAARLKAEKGMGVIAESIAQRLQTDSDTVISGLRNAEELGVFKKIFGNSIVVLEIYAPPEVRYSRLARGSRKYLIKDYKEFLGRERNELEGLGQASIQGAADSRIENTGSIEDLRRNVRTFLDSRKSR